ncbi:MAG: sterol desaturase family protein [Chloroflexi bacterium]|nr:sterol desaturase family protein [Chloroflexota bacterium]
MYDQVPIRLFKSDALEWFTHVSPVVVVILFLPVVIGSLVYGVLHWTTGVSWLLIPLLFAAGLSIWTLTEYLVHRFFFHLEPRSVWGKRLIFLFHGIHHVQPHVKTRLVMPPAVSIPGAALFYVLFALLFRWLGAAEMMWPAFAGFTLGYISYDLLHYSEHHMPMKGAVLKFLKRHHMEHHYKTPQARFGVSTSMWDEVFHSTLNHIPKRITKR